MKYNSVVFGKKITEYTNINACSATGGTLSISTEDKPGKVIAKLVIPKGNNWSVVKKAVLSMPRGVSNLIVQLKGSGRVEVDWISFE